jgi:thioesterase domain-containing protein
MDYHRKARLVILDPSLQAIDAHYRGMPPVAVMDLRIDGYADGVLRLHAPLARHVNDKGCAFGGSLVSLMTLAAWGVATLRLEQAGIPADVFVADSEVRYRAPLYDDLLAEARLADEGQWTSFLAVLRARGRAGIRLAACVRLPDGRIAAEMGARYVAVAKG